MNVHNFVELAPKNGNQKASDQCCRHFHSNYTKRVGKDLTLRKGDLVHLELEESDIVISATKSKQISQSKPLNIEEFKDQKILELCITASYIQGNDMTEIVSKTKIDPDQKRWIRKAADGLIGVEITEDFADRVVLQNFADPPVRV